jgi:hypothetical protein
MSFRIDKSHYLITLKPGIYRITVIFKLDPDASDSTNLISSSIGIESTDRSIINSVIVKSDTYKGHIESTIDIIKDIQKEVTYKFFIEPGRGSSISILQGSSIFITNM